MPDREIEQMVGDSLEPTPQFVASLRATVAGEWRGDIDIVEPAPMRRREWKVSAAFVAAAALLLGVAWMTTRGEDSDTVAPSPSTGATETTVPTNSSPTAGVPSTLLGQLWVVTTKAGLTVDGPDLPTFTFRADDTILGWDGCNEYVVSTEGVEQTAAGCPDGVVPVMAAPPYTFTSGADLTTPVFQAELFDKLPDTSAAPDIARHYRFGTVGGFTISENGTLSIDSNGCEIYVGGTWTVAGDELKFDVPAMPDCYALDPTFQTWLQQMNDTGAVISFHLGVDASAMWTRIGARVTRLAFDDRSIPTAAIGTWVVTEVAGVPYTPTTNIPTFTFDENGSLAGFDGCNSYSFEGQTVVPCEGVQTVNVSNGPFEILDDGRLQAGDAIATLFRPEREGAGSPGLIGNWQFNAFDALLLNDGNSFIAGRPDCLSAGTWDSDGQTLQLTVTSSTPCPAAPEFGAWLQAAAVGNADIAVHDTDRGIELWVMASDGAVTRLVKM